MSRYGMNKKIPNQEYRVRFAPSPTGNFHIGGARTALFNWLFARSNNGKFLVRIEDTDKERSSQEFLDSILNSMKWLGLEWDEELFIQSQAIGQHRTAVDELLKSGGAYKCFCTLEELDVRRKESYKNKIPYTYERTCYNLTAGEVQEKVENGMSFAVRYTVPEGVTEFYDVIHGKTVFQNKDIDDFIILRTDGTPTYQLAAVVDDHTMNITHIIRGDDHLSNTPKQIMLYQSFGWCVPEFAHMPMILGPDKTRLSKRHGAVSVEIYRERGYLPEALRNFLLLLGWSPGDDREVIPLAEVVHKFDLRNSSKKSAVFDETKLEWMNGQYISSLETDELSERLIPYVKTDAQLSEKVVEKGSEYFKQVLELVKTRMKLLTDLIEFGCYFYKNPVVFDPKVVKKYWKDDEVMERLGRVRLKMIDIDDFSEKAIEISVRDLAGSLEISAAKLIHPIRLALTGFGIGPGLFEVMCLLGKETVVVRLEKAIRYLNKL